MNVRVVCLSVLSVLAAGPSALAQSDLDFNYIGAQDVYRTAALAKSSSIMLGKVLECTTYGYKGRGERTRMKLTGSVAAGFKNTEAPGDAVFKFNRDRQLVSGSGETQRFVRVVARESYDVSAKPGNLVIEELRPSTDVPDQADAMFLNSASLPEDDTSRVSAVAYTICSP